MLGLRDNWVVGLLQLEVFIVAYLLVLWLKWIHKLGLGDDWIVGLFALDNFF